MKLHIIHTPQETSIYLNQQAIVENLIANAELDHDYVNSTLTPYRLGLPVDKVPSNDNLPYKRQEECQIILHSNPIYQPSQTCWLNTPMLPHQVISHLQNMRLNTSKAP